MVGNEAANIQRLRHSHMFSHMPFSFLVYVGMSVSHGHGPRIKKGAALLQAHKLVARVLGVRLHGELG